MNDAELERDIKELIISTVALEEVSPDDIDSEAPLFGDGLGLDSIDALEIGLAISKKFAVKLSPESENVREHFHSVNSLKNFILSQSESQSNND